LFPLSREALLNEPELLNRLRIGDHHAFTALYRHHSQPLYYNILALLKDEFATEELVQEVFTRIWQRHSDIQIHTSFGGYLFQVSRNLVHDFFRRLNREEMLYDRIKNMATEEYFHVEEVMLAKENASLLKAAIASLSPQRRRAFELCKIDGYSYQQASETMGISLSTLKDHMANARESLRDYLSRNRETAMILGIFLLFKA
jgi:RNA polymerase sigma factor (sigma-70 family)